jgi:hypothetical protein
MTASYEEPISEHHDLIFASGADGARCHRPRTNPGFARITGRFAPWE